MAGSGPGTAATDRVASRRLLGFRSGSTTTSSPLYACTTHPLLLLQHALFLEKACGSGHALVRVRAAIRAGRGRAFHRLELQRARRVGRQRAGNNRRLVDAITGDLESSSGGSAGAGVLAGRSGVVGADHGTILAEAGPRRADAGAAVVFVDFDRQVQGIEAIRGRVDGDGCAVRVGVKVASAVRLAVAAIVAFAVADVGKQARGTANIRIGRRAEGRRLGDGTAVAERIVKGAHAVLCTATTGLCFGFSFAAAVSKLVAVTLGLAGYRKAIAFIWIVAVAGKLFDWELREATAVKILLRLGALTGALFLGVPTRSPRQAVVVVGTDLSIQANTAQSNVSFADEARDRRTCDWASVHGVDAFTSIRLEQRRSNHWKAGTVRIVFGTVANALLFDNPGRDGGQTVVAQLADHANRSGTSQRNVVWADKAGCRRVWQIAAIVTNHWFPRFGFREWKPRFLFDRSKAVALFVLRTVADALFFHHPVGSVCQAQVAQLTLDTRWSRAGQGNVRRLDQARDGGVKEVATIRIEAGREGARSGRVTVAGKADAEQAALTFLTSLDRAVASAFRVIQGTVAGWVALAHGAVRVTDTLRAILRSLRQLSRRVDLLTGRQVNARGLGVTASHVKARPTKEGNTGLGKTQRIDHRHRTARVGAVAVRAIFVADTVIWFRVRKVTVATHTGTDASSWRDTWRRIRIAVAALSDALTVARGNQRRLLGDRDAVTLAESSRSRKARVGVGAAIAHDWLEDLDTGHAGAHARAVIFLGWRRKFIILAERHVPVRVFGLALVVVDAFGESLIANHRAYIRGTQKVELALGAELRRRWLWNLALGRTRAVAGRSDTDAARLIRVLDFLCDATVTSSRRQHPLILLSFDGVEDVRHKMGPQQAPLRLGRPHEQDQQQRSQHLGFVSSTTLPSSFGTIGANARVEGYLRK